MGWMMLFWVAVIVGVPTVFWFLLSEGGPENDDLDREKYEDRVEHPRATGKRRY